MGNSGSTTSSDLAIGEKIPKISLCFHHFDEGMDTASESPDPYDIFYP